MATIVCYGDSNTWGAIPMPSRAELGRFAPADRWPGVLREKLGPSHTVIEEGLNGRTTVHDDPDRRRPVKNGHRFLPVVLETHAPIDLVIIKLGTNDLKMRFSVPAYDIADGAGRLVDLVARLEERPGQGAAEGAPRRAGAAGRDGLDRRDVRRRDREVEDPRQGIQARRRRPRRSPSSTPARWSARARSTASTSTRTMQRKLGEAIAAMVPGILAG